MEALDRLLWNVLPCSRTDPETGEKWKNLRGEVCPLFNYRPYDPRGRGLFILNLLQEQVDIIVYSFYLDILLAAQLWSDLESLMIRVSYARNGVYRVQRNADSRNE